MTLPFRAQGRPAPAVSVNITRGGTEPCTWSYLEQQLRSLFPIHFCGLQVDSSPDPTLSFAHVQRLPEFYSVISSFVFEKGKVFLVSISAIKGQGHWCRTLVEILLLSRTPRSLFQLSLKWWKMTPTHFRGTVLTVITSLSAWVKSSGN